MPGLISLTYDDALDSQLKHAGPALARHKFKGTFYISDRGMELRAQPQPWIKLRKAGHEFAAHTLLHPCPHAAIWNPQGVANPDVDEFWMRHDMRENIDFIRILGESRPEISFAYPCGVTWLGRPRRSYVPLARELFCASRGVKHGYEDPSHPDLDESKCIDASGKSGVELIRAASHAIEHGLWAIYMFHGVGGDHLSVTAQAHQQLLAFLAAQGKKAVVAPYGDLARRLKRRH